MRKWRRIFTQFSLLSFVWDGTQDTFAQASNVAAAGALTAWTFGFLASVGNPAGIRIDGTGFFIDLEANSTIDFEAEAPRAGFLVLQITMNYYVSNSKHCDI